MTQWIEKAIKVPHRPWFLWAVATVLLAAHVLLVFRHFPPSVWMSGFPFMSGDLPLHFSACHVGHQMLSAGGRLWGYAPDFMAGYPFGIWDSLTQRGYEYATLLFPGATVATAFNLYVVLTALLPPLVIVLACLVLGFNRKDALLCLCVSVVVYQMDDPLAYFWKFGNMGFPFVSSLALLCIAFAVRGIEQQRASFLVAAGVLLAAVGWLHQMVLAPLLAGALIIIFLQRRKIFTGKGFLLALIVSLLALALLLPWLHLLLQFRDFRVPRETTALPSGWKNLVMDLFSDRAYLHHFDRRALLHAELVLLALGGFVYWRRQSIGVRVCALTAIASMAFAYSFSYSGFLKQTEPYRYLVSFSILAVIPVTMGLKELYGLFDRANQAARLATVLLGLALAPSFTAYAIDIAVNKPAEVLNAKGRAVIGWLREHGNHKGRILCPDDQLADALPYFTGYEVLGGGMTRVSPLPHKMSWMRGRVLLGRGSTNATAEALGEYLKAYNIAYAVMPAQWPAGRLLQVPGWSICHQGQGYVVYAADPASLSFVSGGGSTGESPVEARFNSLRVQNAPKGKFTLKYHYLKTLKVSDGVHLRPVYLAEDPVPFIGVDNSSGREVVEISNG